VQRDFVIQFRPDCDLGNGQFQGRLEHIDSGRSGSFRTIAELATLLTRLAVELEIDRPRLTADNSE
jgi:hypothetical protein